MVITIHLSRVLGPTPGGAERFKCESSVEGEWPDGPGSGLPIAVYAAVLKSYVSWCDEYAEYARHCEDQPCSGTNETTI